MKENEIFVEVMEIGESKYLKILTVGGVREIQ